MRETTVAIVGLGYWGPNLLRNFTKTPGVRVAYACDLRDDVRETYARLYPHTTFIAEFDRILADPAVEGVVIATPVRSHYSLAKAALEAGKHVLAEKPLAATSAEARELVALADGKNLTLLVDHTFAYEDAVHRIVDYAASGALGRLLYFDSTRINLGLIQSDSNVLWDLAVHDLSILTLLKPLSDVTQITAIGHKHYTDHEEEAHLHLTYADGFSAHIHVSWLSPVKIRQTLIGGTEKMIVYNDNEPSEKIRLYDKGIHVTKEEQTFALPVYRSGDIIIPRLTSKEPLAELAAHFAACIRGEAKPHTSGNQGAEVVEILELAMQSLRSQATITRAT